MRISKKLLVVVLLAAVAGTVLATTNLIGQCPPPVLQKVKDTGVIKVGMREAARPFAYIDEQGNHVGFSVDMAYLLVQKLSEYAGRAVKITPITVTPKTRIPLVVNGTVDVEMGSTTHTAPREDVADFSLPFFLSQTMFMVRADSGIKTLQDLNGKIVSSARGTTNLKALQDIIAKGIIKPKSLVIVETHAEGLLALETGKIDAYFTDQSLLMGLKMSAKHPEDFVIINESIHSEPYGWVMRENDSDWRDFVNNFLIWTLQTPCSDELATLQKLNIVTECKDPNFTIFDAIYDKWMGPNSKVPLPRSTSFNDMLEGIQWPDVLEVWPTTKK